MPLKGIIFDFDGVLCESVEVKTKAFRKLFAQFPEQIDKIVDLHRQNGGMSRFTKFEIIYRDYLKKELTPAKSEELGRRFSQLCYEGVIQAPLVNGTREFLVKYHTHVRLFVASGTPDEELKTILKERKLEQYFRGVYGTPATKNEILSRILKEFNFDAGDVIFIGDSINDYDGAQKTGIPFVARRQEQNANFIKSLPKIKVIQDLKELDVWLQNKNLIPTTKV